MELKKIDSECFENFARQYQQRSFFQTTAMITRRAHDGWDAHYLGFYKEDVLVGVCALTSHPYHFNTRMFEATDTPLINFKEDTYEAFKLLTAYLDEQQAYHCIIKPNVIRAFHKPEEELCEYNEDSDLIVNNILKAGWNEISNSDDNDDFMNWIYYKDLSPYKDNDSLKASFNASTRRKVNKALNAPLKAEYVGLDKIDEVIELLQMSADREGFTIRNKNYFETLYQNFKKTEDIEYVLIQLDVNAYRKQLHSEIQQLKLDIETVNKEENPSKKRLNLMKDAQNKLIANTQKLDKLKDVKEDYVNINSGVFIIIKDEMIYLSGGSDDAYYSFNGLLYLQWEMMRYCQDHKIKYYNFYGTRGSFCGRSQEDGVYNFKRGFNGQLVQKIGYFEYQPNTLKNKIIHHIRKIKK